MFGVLKMRPLLIALALPMAVGLLGGVLGGEMRETYAALTLPAFAPPGWLFGLVWPILYLLMGLASYLIWVQPEDARNLRTQALTFYAVQLLPHLLWPLLFFRLQLFTPAFWLQAVLLVLAMLTAALFFLLRKRTLLLMLPYLGWLIYAAALGRAVAAYN